MAAQILTREILHEELIYTPETGVFMWKKRSQGRQLDRPAGSFNTNGYRQIRLFGKLHLAHRLAWIYVHGSIDQELTIDHINGERDDNRISNLRLVTLAENIRASSRWAVPIDE